MRPPLLRPWSRYSGRRWRSKLRLKARGTQGNREQGTSRNEDSTHEHSYGAKIETGQLSRRLQNVFVILQVFSHSSRYERD
jgi:hypothetical protein